MPETAGVALEDMDRVFGSEVGREDALRRREVRVFHNGLHLNVRLMIWIG